MNAYTGFLIYGLKDPITQQIRYVGKSCSGVKRPSEHLRQHQLSKKSHKSSWIKSLLNQGLIPEIVILELAETATDLDALEIKWIAELNSTLVNHMRGGGGCLGMRHSDEVKRKIADGARRNMTVEKRQKMKEGIRRVMKNPELRLKYSKAKGQKPFKAISPEGKDLGIWESIREFARAFNLDSSSVCRTLRGKYSNTKGYTLSMVVGQ